MFKKLLTQIKQLIIKLKKTITMDSQTVLTDIENGLQDAAAFLPVIEALILSPSLATVIKEIPAIIAAVEQIKALGVAKAVSDGTHIAVTPTK